MPMSNDALYKRIQERVREEFLSFPGPNAEVRIPSERELQERYQVSRPTISKALAALAAEGLLVNKPKSGYFRQRAVPGKSSSTSSLRRIGYVGPLAGEELMQRAFQGIDRVAHRRRFRVLMGNAGNDMGREQAAVHALIDSGVSGIIITPYPRTIKESLSDYLYTEPLGVPVVLLDSGMPEQGATHVIFDNQRAGYDMTNWLIAERHRRIGLLSYPETVLHGPLTARLSGYKDSLRDHDIDFDPALVRRFDPSQDHIAAWTLIMDEWQALQEPPTALIMTEDIAALEMIEFLTRRGVRVPEEMTVVGFDNRVVAKRIRQLVATTAPDFERMGEIGCNLLLQIIETGISEPRTVVLDAPLLIRRAQDTAGAVSSLRDAVTF
jgi:GntR family transcriptional regulator of arabinose operon